MHHASLSQNVLQCSRTGSAGGKVLCIPEIAVRFLLGIPFSHKSYGAVLHRAQVVNSLCIRLISLANKMFAQVGPEHPWRSSIRCTDNVKCHSRNWHMGDNNPIVCF